MDQDTPHAVEANIEWQLLRQERVPFSLAVRIEPYPGPFSTDDNQIRAIAQVTHSLIAKAQESGVTPKEIQIDFDCAQTKLTGYRAWLRTLKSAVRPLHLVITALPSWLDQPDFRPLVHDADSYVLQVHSVPALKEGGRVVLFDPALARRWVAKASQLGLPFSISLPTYYCLAGFDQRGKLKGVAMDGVQRAWPVGTQTLIFAANADEIAGMVREWDLSTPTGLLGLLWYRIPPDLLSAAEPRLSRCKSCSRGSARCKFCNRD